MNARELFRPNVITVALLLLMAILAGGAARRESITVDEVAHVGAGVSYLQKLDYRMNEEHPPLAKVLAAIPLVIRGVRADYSDTSWIFSAGFFHQYLGEWVFGHEVATKWNDPYATMFWARIPMLLLMLLLGRVLYAYGTKLGDARGGLLCLTAYVTTPAFLTFGPLVLTDIAITLFVILTLWTFADMWQEPTRAAVIKFGFAFAGALLSKFSAGLLFFCFAAVILSLRLRPTELLPQGKAERKAWRRKRLWSLTKGTLLAGAIVYVTYLVLSWNQPTDLFSLMKHFPSSQVLRRVLMPIATYLRGIVGFAFASSRPTFILGHFYPHGVWFYFPILFFLKSQLAFVLLLVLALGAAMFAKQRLQVRAFAVAEDTRMHWRAVWMFLLIFTLACCLSRLTISIRHFSVPLALLILTLAPLPKTIELLRNDFPQLRFAGWAAVGLAVVLIVNAIRVYPYYFPYLSSFGMGHPGYELMNDSNLDWNQALPEVEHFAVEHGLKRVLIDEYGFSDPTVYVPQAQFWDCQDPAPSDAGQTAVVSAGMIEDGNNCLWLLGYPHETLAGGGMYVFQLPSPIPPQGTPGGPPTPDTWRTFAGIPMKPDPRLTFLKCIRDPQQLQPTWDWMTAQFQAMMDKQEAEKKMK